MPYDVSVPEESDYVLIEWRGSSTRAEIEASGADGLRVAAEHDRSKLLIDASAVENKVPPTDLFAATLVHAQLGPPRPLAALVGRPDQWEDLRFIETVGRNRGMPIRAFADESEAVKWLSGS